MRGSELSARQGEILGLVRSAGFVGIDALAQRFAVTPQTVRRLVNELCARGMLRRVHGGVSTPAQGRNLAYEHRRVLNREAKLRIARAVADFIPDGASLFIGLGTTPEQVALALTERAGLKVMTNSLNVACCLAANPEIEISIAGGSVRHNDLDVIGSEAASFYGRYRADFGIFGVAGIEPDGTLLDFQIGEVQAREAMLANCRAAVLVADVSKFGRSASARGGQLEQLDHVFLDAPPPADYAPLFANARPQLHIAPEDRP